MRRDFWQLAFMLGRAFDVRRYWKFGSGNVVVFVVWSRKRDRMLHPQEHIDAHLWPDRYRRAEWERE